MAQLEEYVDLLPYNTFHIASTARYFVRVQCPNQLDALVHSPIFQTRFHFVLGGGSNILLANETYEAIVLKNEISGIEIVSQDEKHTVLRVGGGVAWTALVSYCLDHGLGGLENLSLIPGTVGAAPIQNIGAYGVELSDVLESVCAIDLTTGSRRQMSNAECQFGYRDSVFKHTSQECLHCQCYSQARQSWQSSIEYDIWLNSKHSGKTRSGKPHDPVSCRSCVSAAQEQIA